mmetsp:Transcript_31637/g.74456  ORF Transcript_31637/g.74456 Transcript_31637/m.74456 type:complete len:492 (+) Transcript_31637:259-1734(+)
MQYAFILPSRCDRSVAMALMFFVTCTCLGCFNILVTLHHQSVSFDGLAEKSLRAEFTGRPPLQPTNSDPKVVKAIDKTPVKEETPVASSEVVKPSNTTINSDLVCVPSGKNSDYDFFPTTKYKESKTIPRWMIEYFDWHREQTLILNECNYKDFKYMILRCSDQDKKCGGLADRLKSLPFFLAAAARTKRIFLIRWDRPCKLEHFLLPNEINWSVPDWLPGKVDNFMENPNAYFIPSGKRLYRMLERYKDILIIEGLVQDFYGGSAYYHKLDCELDDLKTYNETEANILNDMMGWKDYETFFHDLFRLVFKPVGPLQERIDKMMKDANVTPGHFAAAHYRAFYATEDVKDSIPISRHQKKTINALNCASRLQPGDPIYFASDSNVAVEEAKKMNDQYEDRRIVTVEHEAEALHLDRGGTISGHYSDFYPSFVDFLFMGNARCIVFGEGGFGRFANLLSMDPFCVMKHDGDRKGNPKCTWVSKEDDLREKNW